LVAQTTYRASTQYHIADPFLAFWYRFIDGRRSMLRHGQLDAALAQIMQDLDEHVGRYIFEQICRTWIWDALQRGQLPADLDVAEVGTWWSAAKGEQDEIDVIALSSQHEAVLFGECKWSNSPMDLRDLGGLRHAIDVSRRSLRPVLAPWRVCFSRSGFHADLAAEAADPAACIQLVDLEQLYS
jgi:hypothetical protein